MSATPRPRRSSALPLLLLPLAVAVASALLALRLHFQPPTVPPFAIASASDQATLAAGGWFELDIRPAAPVTGAVGARAFLLRGNEVRPWDPPLSVSRDGSVRIAGAVDDLFAKVPVGPWEVAVAVGRPETLPTAPQDVLRRRNADGDVGRVAWRLLRREIRLER